MNIIAIDCGASFIKGALLEDTHILRTLSQRSPRVHCDEPITQTIQIDSLIDNVKKLVEALAADIEDFVLCVSNEMHGFILADHEGRALTDYISWQKEYGNIIVSNDTAMGILERECADEIAHTGMPLRSGLPSSNLMYLKLAGVLDRLPTPVYLYPLGDFIIRALSGKNTGCHPTNAAALGFYDLRTSKWNKKICDMAGGGKVCFPTIGSEIVEFRFKGHSVRALPAIGDQQAALLGSGFNRKDMVSYNLGTGAQVSVITNDIKRSGNYQIRPYFDGEYLKSIPHIPSGRAINVYIRFVAGVLKSFGCERNEEDIWNVLLKNASVNNVSRCKCDLSFFENAVSDNTKGSITDIPEYGVDMESLMSTIITQMAENSIQLADSIIHPQNVKEVVFSGGIARRIPMLRDIIIGHYDKNIGFKVAENETIMGLASYSIGCL